MMRTFTTQYKDIVIFGCGYFGKKIFKMFEQILDYQIALHLADSYVKDCVIEGKKYDVLIISSAVAALPKALFVLGSIEYTNEMREQLLQLGVPASQIVENSTLVTNFAAFSCDRLVPQKSIYHIDYEIVSHCNLRCNNCQHFSNIADKSFLPPPPR